MVKIFIYIVLCSLLYNLSWGQNRSNPLDYPDTLWLYGKSTDNKYGLTPQKPIKVGGGTFPKNNYTYLNNLTDETGKPVKFKRIGSCCSDIIKRDEPLTAFTVQTSTGKEITLYFDQYEWEKPQLVKGLEWKENRKGYHGEAKNDTIFHGNGIYFFEDGGYYKGQWVNGMMEGKGILFVPGTETYEGDFKNGEYDGTGILTYADGGRYEGQWQAGKRHGKGKLFYPPGSEILYMEGNFENGKPIGDMTVIYRKGKKEIQHF